MENPKIYECDFCDIKFTCTQNLNRNEYRSI